MDGPKADTAVKLIISDFLSAQYIKQEGWEPDYLFFMDIKVKRANIIGNIIAIQEETMSDTLLLDDGSGKVPARLFEHREQTKNVIVGDTVLAIGRPRLFGQERYLHAEIIKKLSSPQWIHLRKLEAKQEGKNAPEEVMQEAEPKEDLKMRVYRIIKKMDIGGGVAIEDVAKAEGPEAERTIQELLRAGDIFEVRPGWIKALE